MIRFGLPLVPATLISVLNPLVDRIFLLRLSSLEVVGEYAVALRFPALVAMATSAFSLVFAPYALRLATEKREQLPVFLRDTLNWVLLLWGLAFCALALTTAPLFRLLIDVTFWGGIPVVWLLSLAHYSTAAAIITNIGFGLAKASRPALVLATVSFLVNVILNLILIPSFGMAGAALATAFAGWIGVLGGIRFTEVFLGDRIFRVRGFAILGVVGIAGVLGNLFRGLGLWQELGMAGLSLIPLGLLCLWLSDISFGKTTGPGNWIGEATK